LPIASPRRISAPFNDDADTPDPFLDGLWARYENLRGRDGQEWRKKKIRARRKNL